MWPTDEPSPEARASFAEAAPEPFWLSGSRPAPREPLEGTIDVDLLIVGGGLTGLWAAVRAAEEQPGRSIALIEQDTIAIGASGRNGGFMSSSLVHGIGNGLTRFPEEMETLERLGLENLKAIKETIRRHGIDCDLESAGVIGTAMTTGQLEGLEGGAEELRRYGHEATYLNAEEMRAEVDSPLFKGGLWHQSGECSVNPVKLCDGLLELAESLGVKVHEETEMVSMRRAGAGVDVATDGGTVRARRVLLATAAFRSPVRAIRTRVVPVFDYVLVSEPLSTSQWDAVGWKRRQGLSDSSNQFHYYRPTADGRILWGGYDAIYNYGGRVDEQYYQRDESYAGLAQRFFTLFPQLAGLRFTHRWGGAIDTCSRFFAFYGTTMGGRVAYAVGHTGLGVGASRFSAGVALDLLDGRENEVTGLNYTRSKPMPFPPEPLRWGTIQLTRNRIAAADRKDGKLGLWLKTLDRLGLGFDS